jgi:hypothetical protein
MGLHCVSKCRQTARRMGLTTRALSCISHSTKDTTNTKVTASMNIWWIEALLLLDCSCDTCVVRLCQNLLHQLRIRHAVDDPWNKVALQAVRRRQIYCEVLFSEGAIHYASATRATSDVQAVLHRCSFHAVPIASKSRIGIEDLGVKRARRCLILGLSIQRPIPVWLSAGVTTFFP